eukprot:COSAG05_NODE_19153_length_297_cov_0.429293_1_plen_84_part_01
MIEAGSIAGEFGDSCRSGARYARTVTEIMMCEKLYCVCCVAYSCGWVSDDDRWIARELKARHGAAADSCGYRRPRMSVIRVIGL